MVLAFVHFTNTILMEKLHIIGPSCDWVATFAPLAVRAPVEEKRRGGDLGRLFLEVKRAV